MKIDLMENGMFDHFAKGIYEMGCADGGVLKNFSSKDISFLKEYLDGEIEKLVNEKAWQGFKDGYTKHFEHNSESPGGNCIPIFSKDMKEEYLASILK